MMVEPALFTVAVTSTGLTLLLYFSGGFATRVKQKLKGFTWQLEMNNFALEFSSL